MMGKSVCFISGKGGVGKTTLAAALGKELAKTKKVLLVELDCGFRGLDLLFQESGVLYHLGDNLSGDDPQTGIRQLRDSGLYFLPAGSDTDYRPEPGRLRARIRQFEGLYDMVLLDAPCGWGPTVQAACRAADEVVAVATPDAVCVRGASTVSERAWALGAQNQRLLLNMVQVDRPSDNPITDFDTILDLVAVPLLGVVPFDRQVHACLGKKEDSGKPLYKECIAAVAKRLQGEQVPLKVG